MKGEGGTFVTPAVVLRSTSIRESDLVVVLLTAVAGKVDTLARGARRSRRRFPGGLPVGARGEATIAVEGRNRGSLARLDGFAHAMDLSALGADLEVFAYTQYLCELCDHLVTGTQPDPRIFASLCVALDATVRRPSPPVLRAFELALIDALGWLPALDGCGVCGREIARRAGGRVPFDAPRGGALCELHAQGTPSAIDGAVLGLASELLGGAPDAHERCAAAPAEQRRGLKELCQTLVRQHLRRPLRSTEFFAHLAAERPRGNAP